MLTTARGSCGSSDEAVRLSSKPVLLQLGASRPSHQHVLPTAFLFGNIREGLKLKQCLVTGAVEPKWTTGTTQMGAGLRVHQPWQSYYSPSAAISELRTTCRALCWASAWACFLSFLLCGHGTRVTVCGLAQSSIFTGH